VRRATVLLLMICGALTLAAEPKKIETDAARPATPQVSGTGVWDSGEYAYDGSGNIKAIGSATDSDGKIDRYQYDTVGRLLRGTASTPQGDYVQKYTYDTFGNRLSSTLNDSITYEMDVNDVSNRFADVAVAYDAAGNQANAASVTIHVSNAVVALPTVTVTAAVPNASRIAPASGQFTLTRSGDTSLALPVNYLLSGTASNGFDYVALSASITFPAGMASMPINVTPLPRSSCVDSKTATFALAPSPAYSVGLADRATVTIGGNSVPLTIAKATGNDFKLTWASDRGRAYRVAFKPTLNNTAWINLSGLLTANKTTTSSYTDNSATGQAQRYYVVYVTN